MECVTLFATIRQEDVKPVGFIGKRRCHFEGLVILDVRIVGLGAGTRRPYTCGPGSPPTVIYLNAYFT